MRSLWHDFPKFNKQGSYVLICICRLDCAWSLTTCYLTTGGLALSVWTLPFSFSVVLLSETCCFLREWKTFLITFSSAHDAFHLAWAGRARKSHLFNTSKKCQAGVKVYHLQAGRCLRSFIHQTLLWFWKSALFPQSYMLYFLIVLFYPRHKLEFAT